MLGDQFRLTYQRIGDGKIKGGESISKLLEASTITHREKDGRS